MTAHLHIQPALDGLRALHVKALAALIDQTLADRTSATATLPDRAARALLTDLVDAGLARLDPILTPRASVAIHGIVACTDSGGAAALLRAWQHAARDRLAGGRR